MVQDFFDERNETSPKHSLQDSENFPRRNPISAAETEKQSFPGAFQLPRRGVAMEEGEWERACDQLGGVSQGGGLHQPHCSRKKPGILLGLQCLCVLAVLFASKRI